MAKFVNGRYSMEEIGDSFIVFWLMMIMENQWIWLDIFGWMNGYILTTNKQTNK